MSRSDSTERATLRRYAHAMRLYRRGRWRQAAAALRALSDRPGALGRAARMWAVRAYRAEAARAAGEHRYEDAARALAGAIEMSPAAPAGGRRIPRPAPAALEELERRLADGRPVRPDRARKFAQLLWQAGRREEAYMALTEALRREGNDPQLLLTMGLFLAAEERFDEARPVLARAAEAGCDLPEAHRALGLVAAAQDDVVGAVRSLQRAVELAGDDLLLAAQLVLMASVAEKAGARVRVHLPVGPVEGAAGGEALSRSLAVDGELAEALLAGACLDDDADLLAALVAAVERAAAQFGGTEQLHRVAAEACRRLGRCAAAVEHAHRALSLNPASLPARVLLAELHADAGRTEQAVAEYRRALADGADWADVHYRLGVLLARSGRSGPAREHLARALELNRNYTPAADALASLAA